MTIGDLFYPPSTRVLARAIGWMTLDEVRQSVARVRSRGGYVSSGLDDKWLAEAPPGRVHAILQSQALPGYDPFFELRLWNGDDERSYGCPLDLEPEEAASFPLYPDAVYHDLVAAKDRGYFTE